MSWAIQFLVVWAILVPIHVASAEHSLTRSYDVSIGTLQHGVSDPTGLSKDGSIDVGGVMFPASDLSRETPDFVRIVDVTGGEPRGAVCQDSDMNGVCGESGEPNVGFCGNTSPGNVLWSNRIPFVPDLDVYVFVYPTPVGVSAMPPGVGIGFCSSLLPLGTQGTVTMILD